MTNTVMLTRNNDIIFHHCECDYSLEERYIKFKLVYRYYSHNVNVWLINK